jgi:integrase
MSSKLLDSNGRRLYLTQEERAAFMKVVATLPRHHRTFCTILHDTGCRISEALALTGQRIDLNNKTVVFETLKQRRDGIYRPVPLPDTTLDTLDMVHGLREAQRSGKPLGTKLWSFTRMTGWRIVAQAMADAQIPEGPHRSPKGLRHGFGMNAILKGVPVTSLKTWMGHAKLETTAIYLEAVGAESREIAARMW